MTLCICSKETQEEGMLSLFIQKIIIFFFFLQKQEMPIITTKHKRKSMNASPNVAYYAKIFLNFDIKVIWIIKILK